MYQGRSDTDTVGSVEDTVVVDVVVVVVVLCLDDVVMSL